jgi:hypothetical protein
MAQRVYIPCDSMQLEGELTIPQHARHRFADQYVHRSFSFSEKPPQRENAASVASLSSTSEATLPEVKGENEPANRQFPAEA